jgi:hypothetical protein
MLKLKEKLVPDKLMAKDLKDGQLAIIVEDYFDYKDRIIQKFGDDLITVGMSSGNGWVGGANINTLEVRVLKDGEVLIVSNNK